MPTKVRRRFHPYLLGTKSNKTVKPRKNDGIGGPNSSSQQPASQSQLPMQQQSSGQQSQYDLNNYTVTTLGSGNLRLAVMLPEGEDVNEWVAVNTVDFFNQINMLYGTITEFCTEQSCPVMSAGAKYEYHWADGQIIKKPIKCSAPRYVDYLMNWIQSQVDNEAIFPSAIGVPFPKSFLSIAKTILKRLFRVYAHIYYEHFHQVLQLQEEAHLNTSFKHFIYFVQEFELVEKKELAPLQELIDKLKAKDKVNTMGDSNYEDSLSPK